MTTDEQATIHDICNFIRKTLVKMENADYMYDVANMCTWVVGDLMRIQKLAAHRARIVHTDLQRKANK